MVLVYDTARVLCKVRMTLSIPEDTRVTLRKLYISGCALAGNVAQGYVDMRTAGPFLQGRRYVSRELSIYIQPIRVVAWAGPQIISTLQ